MAELSTWFSENELILNLEKEKIEALLFGTPNRIGKCTEPLSILNEDDQINVTFRCKYLGVLLDSSFNLSTDLDYKYKKASGNLRLSEKIRNHLDIKSAKAIYRSVVLPVLTYCGILKLINKTRAQEHRQLDISILFFLLFLLFSFVHQSVLHTIQKHYSNTVERESPSPFHIENWKRDA